MKTAELKAQTRRELAAIAKDYGITGWHGMRKDELVDAISKTHRRLARKASRKAREKGTSEKAAASKSKPSARPSARKSASDKSSVTKSRSGAKTTLENDKKSSPQKSKPKRATKNTPPQAASESKRSSARKPAEAKSSAAGGSTSVSNAKSSPGARKGKSRGNISLNDRPLPEMPAPRVSAKTARIRAQLRRQREQAQRNRDLSTGTLVGGTAVNRGGNGARTGQPHSDRIVLLVRDAYWLQANWEITRATVARAESSLAERWLTSTPILRLLHVEESANNNAETVLRDIPIHGGVDNWYIDVQDPPSRFRVAIGYLVDDDQFHCLCRSNIVETPSPGQCERLDEHWNDIADDYERIYALSGGLESNNTDLKGVFEQRLQRAMPTGGNAPTKGTNTPLARQTNLPFEVDAELIVFGRSAIGSNVSLDGNPIKLKEDGTFTLRMKLPDKRQVLPVTAESRDGLRQRVTVITVERNTKVLDAVDVRDNY
ncbi:MAG: Rho termination protein [Rhodopirellula sp. TMED11]|nr:MAG: Rho termination protein [Rhodopirellula sp. TMED11]